MSLTEMSLTEMNPTEINPTDVNGAVDTSMLDGQSAVLAERLIRWLATGVRSEDLFSADVFGDVSLPLWRVRAESRDELYAVRETGHPVPGTVQVEHLDRTGRGFLLQFAERWTSQGQQWYSREMLHAVVEADRIVELVVYCTGDWDEAVQHRHATEVHLRRP
jgi:hypothetical protein